ncbi:lipopolysaccharide biosynthesis protein [Flavobacterium capsici]|uniref:Lipopolysaccharide biosynthesis protein n=1 Tax=Flavobacterium capsici TaxID=3075618 RepID=A0AA96F080_9FLAO|nr:MULTISPECIES: lipopolysaccharide biosynthesis protein [unclassified Flavobacterium]WNM20222.1 lipopolysaccharide biosynthesis protein [Flavobacterium sp. PMR2A8]WNM21612.1 lipopolysaccharide biosynthesis protein [Flavobacterium sp. PMTSA4]
MSLNSATKKNVKWSFIETISLKLISFILSIILARLLSPSDFGLLAIINVFYLLTVLFIDGGLKEALIQKKDATNIDFSTMFWLNIFKGIFFYVLLFFLAPFIEEFYTYQNLAFYIRIQALSLIIESFGIIQIVKATKELNLKKITVARIPASLISFFVGIYMAFMGYGIMSLIIQQLVNVGIYAILLMYSIRYKPEFKFSIPSLRVLYSFGLKILAVSYISRVYVQSLNLVYGYYFKVSELGLFTKTKSLQGVPIEMIDTTFSKGLYPTMIKIQEHNRLLKKMFLFNVRRLTFLMVLINGILFFNGLEIITILLGPKWIEAVPFVKIAAVGSLFSPINTQVVSIFKAKGKPGFILKLEMIWKIVVLTLIIFLATFAHFQQILWMVVIINSIMGIVYLFYCSKLIEFQFKKEMKLIFFLFVWYYITGFMISEFSRVYLYEIQNVFKIIFFIVLYSVSGYLFGLRVKEFNLIKMIKFV